jgi:hypothetical protein
MKMHEFSQHKIKKQISKIVFSVIHLIHHFNEQKTIQAMQKHKQNTNSSNHLKEYLIFNKEIQAKLKSSTNREPL